jgi:hypothetical protein
MINTEIMYGYHGRMMSPDVINQIKRDLCKYFDDEDFIINSNNGTIFIDFRKIDILECKKLVMRLRDKLVWMDKTGKEHHIKNMKDSHIRNCLRLIQSRDDWRQEFVSIFKNELQYRRNEKLNRVLCALK